jgi:hypothetical protein
MAVSTVNPWAAGAVVFDTRPYQAFYERQMLRQQAKQDALENYFKDLGKNVTSAGMRSQDVPVLLQKNKDWQQFYQANKAAILNPKLDNGQAYSQYMSGYQDQLGLTNESKEEAKKNQDLAKLRFNAEAKHIFDDPKFVEDKQLDDLPIGDPRRKRFDLLTAALPPKPIGVKELDAYNKYLTGGLKFDEVPGKTEMLPGFKTRTPIYSQYSPENQIRIGSNAANAFDTDKTWRNEAVKFFNQITHDPVELDRYNKAFKSLYGNDIDSPREAWMAKGILDTNMKATEYKEGTDDWARDNAMRLLKKADDKELMLYKKQIDPNDTDMNNTWVSRFWETRIEKAKGNPDNLHTIYGSADKKLTGQGYLIEPNSVMMKALARNGVEPDKVYVTKDNKIWPVFYQYTKDEKGNTVKRLNKNGHPFLDEELSRPMDLDQAYLDMGYRGQTKKDLGGTMEAANIPNKQGVKSGPKIEDLRKKYNY